MTTFTPGVHHERLLRGNAAVPWGLYHLQLAKPDQLCRLHYKMGSITTVKTYLKELATAGYLQRDKIPTKDNSHPFYYTLDTAGLDYLERQGFDTDDLWRSAKEIRQSWLYLYHAIDVNDVVISAMLVDQANSAYSLDYYQHERELKRAPYRPSWMDHTGQHRATLIPDARIDFRFGSDRMPVLLEHDRGTEQQQHFKRKVRAYIMFVKSGSFREILGTSTLTVAFTVFNDPKRLEKMLAWTKAELAGEPAYLRQVFWFANLTPPLTPHIWLLDVWQTPDNSSPLALLAA